MSNRSYLLYTCTNIYRLQLPEGPPIFQNILCTINQYHLILYNILLAHPGAGHVHTYRRAIYAALLVGTAR